MFDITEITSRWLHLPCHIQHALVEKLLSARLTDFVSLTRSVRDKYTSKLGKYELGVLEYYSEDDFN